MAFENLEPKAVFNYFEKLCSIPHGSGNVEKISNYLVSFAKERNLEVRQDEAFNVIIKSPGSAGYEDREPVILQGHMDMVAVKEDGIDIDMKTEGLRTRTDGEYVWAEGTSLGGDDGIAVAYCLALLDSKDIPHPPLEVVITTDEETGMNGAVAIDLSDLKGKRMINIDNEEEGVFITSCAGGARIYTELPVERAAFDSDETLLTVKVEGLLGGHSGEMIKFGRGNAVHILCRCLLTALDEGDIRIVSIDGGVADNAIPFSAAAVIAVDNAAKDKVIESIRDTENKIKGELEVKDPGLKITMEERAESSFAPVTKMDSKKLLSLVCTMPDGVQAMSASVEGLVETSLNLGIIKTSENCITIDQSVRSSVESSKEFLIRKLLLIDDQFGAKYTISGRYPGWKYRPQSDLRDHMVEVYEKLYGKNPTLMAIHAGLECGLLSEKIEGLDCISIGPDMQDIHSTKEKLSIKSTANVWEYLKAVLA